MARTSINKTKDNLYNTDSKLYEFLDNRTGKEAIYKTEFSINLKDEYLNVHFLAHSSKKFSYSNKYNDDLYKGDVVEIFISTTDIDHYLEIEVAPNGTIFLANIYNDGVKANINYINNNFLCVSSKIIDDKYIVDIIIPLKKINYSKERGIRFNAFRIETDGGESEKHLFALNPTLCNSFHRKDFFIKI